MKNYFKGTQDHPYHLSVGAVILNDDGEVCCHYFKQLTLEKSNQTLTEFYLLMRETMEMGETVEGTLHRGMMEEFGVTGEVLTYLGSLQGDYPVGSTMVQKTTLYFLVKMKSFDLALRSQEDAERESEIQWHTADFLIPKMKEQGGRLNPTLDESSILERVRKYRYT